MVTDSETAAMVLNLVFFYITRNNFNRKKKTDFDHLTYTVYALRV